MHAFVRIMTVKWETSNGLLLVYHCALQLYQTNSIAGFLTVGCLCQFIDLGVKITMGVEDDTKEIDASFCNKRIDCNAILQQLNNLNIFFLNICISNWQECASFNK